MRVAVVACLMAACYSPAPPEGALCSALGECPQGLSCIGGRCRSGPDHDASAPGEGLPPDVPPTGCAPPMLGEFDAPSRDGQLSSTAFDGTPTVSGDLLEVYLKSDRSGGLGDFDIWRATRAAAGAAWSDPQPVPELNSASSDESPELAGDGLTLWLTSNRGGNRDIYIATRPTRNSPWSSPTRIAELSTDGNDEGLFVMPSQLVAYLHSDVGRMPGDYRLYRATRASLADAWSPPVPITELDTGVSAENPWVTADDCTMYFHTGVNDEHAIVFTTRTTAGTFGPPIRLESLDAPGFDADPWLTPDQRTILFASDRGGILDAFDLYSASR